MPRGLLGEPADRQRVGVEFLTPAPRFWGWTLRTPRKLPNQTRHGQQESLHSFPRSALWRRVGERGSPAAQEPLTHTPRQKQTYERA